MTITTYKGLLQGTINIFNRESDKYLQGFITLSQYQASVIEYKRKLNLLNAYSRGKLNK